MTDEYSAKKVYKHESSGRKPLLGRYGGFEESVVEGEELEISAEIRRHATYLSPYRMDHIAELHAHRSAPKESSKTLFPASWPDDKIFEAVQSVVVDPESRWSRGDDDWSGEPGTLFNPWHKMADVEYAIPGRFRVDGYYENVKLRVIVEPYGEGIISAYTVD